MTKCNAGYSDEDCCNKDELEGCKGCENLNKDYDLVDQAIESAQCRIYRVRVDDTMTYAHQQKAFNQKELSELTIKALQFYKDNALNPRRVEGKNEPSGMRDATDEEIQSVDDYIESISSKQILLDVKEIETVIGLRDDGKYCKFEDDYLITVTKNNK